MSETTVIVSYRVLPTQVDTAIREIGALIAKVQALEPDCGGIAMLQDVNDLTRISLIERWPSQEIFLGPHMQQPHIQSFMQVAGTFLAGPPEISFWTTVGGV